MNEPYIRIQAALHAESDADLIRHLQDIRAENAALKSQADVLRFILERDRQVSLVYGRHWDWRNVVKTPPYVGQILDAIGQLKGKAIVTVENEVTEEKKTLTLDGGMFDE
jgi:hypothetical protein